MLFKFYFYVDYSQTVLSNLDFIPKSQAQKLTVDLSSHPHSSLCSSTVLKSDFF